MGATRTKILSFNAQVSVSAEQIWAGLEGVVINHGPYIVSWSGVWGELQVWAASHTEGADLIGRVCVLAAIPWGPNVPGDLIFATATDPGRYRPGRFSVKIRKGLAFVSTRSGSDGLPEYPFANGRSHDSADPKGADLSGPAKRFRVLIKPT